jgi:DNA-directed RNA polymerase beta' subunit
VFSGSWFFLVLSLSVMLKGKQVRFREILLGMRVD